MFENQKDLPIARWFRGLSTVQLDAAKGLHKALTFDLDEGSTFRVLNCMRLIGLTKPKATKRQLFKIMLLSRKNELAFLYFLMCAYYKTPEDVKTKRNLNIYNLNEQYIMSAIAKLDMKVTTNGLNRILPPGPESPQKRLSKSSDSEMPKLKLPPVQQSMPLFRNKDQKLLPYFQKQPRPKNYNLPNRYLCLPPRYPACLDVFGRDQSFASKEDGRWFARYELQAERRIVQVLIRNELKTMFDNIDKLNVPDTETLCLYHRDAKKKERTDYVLQARDQCLKLIDVEGHNKEMIRMRIRKQLECDVDRYLNKFGNEWRCNDVEVLTLPSRKCEVCSYLVNAPSLTGELELPDCGAEGDCMTSAVILPKKSSNRPTYTHSKPGERLAGGQQSTDKKSKLSAHFDPNFRTAKSLLTGSQFSPYPPLNVPKLPPRPPSRLMLDTKNAGSSQIIANSRSTRLNDSTNEQPPPPTSSSQIFAHSRGTRLNDSMNQQAQLPGFSTQIPTQLSPRPTTELPARRVGTKSKHKKRCCRQGVGIPALILEKPLDTPKSDHLSHKRARVAAAAAVAQHANRVALGFFQSPSPHTPYAFDYSRVFDVQANLPDLEDEIKAASVRALRRPSSSYMMKPVEEKGAEQKPAITTNWECEKPCNGFCHNRFQPKLNDKVELTSVSSFSRLAPIQRYDVMKAVSMCVENIWNNGLEKICEKLNAKAKKPALANKDSMKLVKVDREYIDPNDEMLMDQMLKDGLSILAKNPKYVLASLPEAHQLPVLREWIKTRYGKLYTANHAANAKTTLRNLQKLTNQAKNKTIPSMKLDNYMNHKLVVSFEEALKLRKTARFVTNEYKRQIKELTLEHTRLYWLAAQPDQHCSSRLREVFFAYLPNRLIDM